MNRLLAALVLATALPAVAGDTAGTTVETTTKVPADQDGCLDHTVRELGMSAKKVDGERRWTIGPQFLHSAVAKAGTLGVKFEKGEQATVIRVTATWPGGPKDKSLQAELESRLQSMASKMAQLCGVTRATVACEVKDPSGKTAPCPPAAP